MSTNYLEGLSQAETRRISLQKEYSSLWEKWRECWKDDANNITLMKQLQEEMYPIYKELREIENTETQLSLEQRKILHDADLDTLKKLYRKCQKERVPYGDLVIELEKEIYRKWIKETKIEADRIYKIDPSMTYSRE
jgi:hypothetical protein